MSTAIIIIGFIASLGLAVGFALLDESKGGRK